MLTREALLARVPNVWPKVPMKLRLFALAPAMRACAAFDIDNLVYVRAHARRGRR